MNDSIAIHGFGRIGRTTTRAALRDNLFVPISISDIQDPKTLVQLFFADTNYGLWAEGKEKVAFEEGFFRIGSRKIPFYDTKEELPDWDKLGVSVVVDCTGRATKREGAQFHLDRGAKKVLVSAPSKSFEDCDAVLLAGINLDEYDPKKHHIVSMASCTTNALAPLVKVLLEEFGIEYGFFTTVHAYTNSQSLVDQPMKDVRDSWAATENIIPSSSGAAKALKFIWPNLNVTGKAYRVPYRTGSIVELNAHLAKEVSVEDIQEAFRSAVHRLPLQGYVEVLEDKWASARVLGETKTCLIDLPLTQVVGKMVSVASWYDNEAGYATRLAEVAKMMAER